jgi:hypothetical protein
VQIYFAQNRRKFLTIFDAENANLPGSHHRKSIHCDTNSTKPLSSHPFNIRMSEFDSTFLYRFVLSETRLLEFLDRKRQQLVNLFLKLRYTRENWNLIMFIFRKDPMTIAFVIVARFLRGFLPSLDMKIEADFLDVVCFLLCQH